MGEADPGVSNIAAKDCAAYFQAHPISALKDQQDTSVKGQILADFSSKNQKPMLYSPERSKTPRPMESYFTDGSSMRVKTGSDAQASSSLTRRNEFTYATAILNSQPRTRAVRSPNCENYALFPRRWTTKKARCLKSDPHPQKLRALSKQVLVEILKNKSISEMEISTAEYVLREIHAGSSSMYSGPRSVVARALRSGYYWPTMHRDARDMIKKCNDCQVHRPIPRQPQQELTPITSPWPFHKWGIDIAGPFPVAAGGLKFLIVAIDYFTKWIEAKAVATITGNQVKRFVWDNIVCRFGLPGEIVSDNGKQFCDNPFKDWCTRLSITQRFASVKHPQTNGLVERANRSLGEGIKARLDRHKGRWVEELSHVLWAHRTTIKVSTGDTPFSLVYGTEAVIPAEIGMPTIRTAEVNIATNDDERRIDLDILEERREQAAIREEKAKLKMKGYYDAKVRGVSFRPGDFVYRANDASHAEDTGKLGPKWEGPYEVTEALGKGAYKLRDMDGRELPRTWNICNLKKCYL
ncbi:reverse transcriptase domain-containing protein [Tanacetum coccineum]